MYWGGGGGEGRGGYSLWKACMLATHFPALYMRNRSAPITPPQGLFMELRFIF